MNILIFGLGFIGRVVAEKCYQQGDNVRAIKRHLSSDDINLPIDLDVLTIDTASWRDEWRNYDTWLIALPPSSLEHYAQSLIHLVDLAEKHNIKHVIYTSSTSVFGNTSGYVNEYTHTQAETSTAQAIVQVETRLLTSTLTHVDILRLGGLYSSQRHPLFSFLKKNQSIHNPEQRVNMVHQDRAVSGILRAINTPQGLRIRHFVETPHLTKREFYTREAKLLGLPQPKFTTDLISQAGKIVQSAFEDFGFEAD